MNAEFLTAVQPVVLVGGRSRRFGRDKLREPWRGTALVQRPIAALREVFGVRVKVVGVCHADVAGLAHGVIDDRHPGIGPIGGILSALEATGGPVFVLAGDMPTFGPEQVRAVAEAAERFRSAVAVLAWGGDRLHPCAGVYAAAARDVLREHVREGRYELIGAVRDAAIRVLIDGRYTANVNTIRDLEAAT